jgi:hypothetical protein
MRSTIFASEYSADYLDHGFVYLIAVSSPPLTNENDECRERRQVRAVNSVMRVFMRFIRQRNKPPISPERFRSQQPVATVACRRLDAWLRPPQ